MNFIKTGYYGVLSVIVGNYEALKQLFLISCELNSLE